MKQSANNRKSIFSQRLDRSTFTAYFLGAIVPLIALAFVVERYVIPASTGKSFSIAMIALVASIAVLSLLSFLILRRTARTTLERIDRDNRRLSALLGTSSALTNSAHASDIAGNAVACALELTSAKAAFLLVRSKTPEAPLEVFESAGTDLEALLQSVGDRVMELGELTLSNGRPAIEHGTRSGPGILVLPLAGESSWLGAIAVVHGRPAIQLERGQIDALTTLAGLTSVAMRNADLRDAQRNFFSHMTDILVTALDAHLDYYDGHSNRVARYANPVGRALNFDEKHLQKLHFAALLHDIGMLKIDKSAKHNEKTCAKHAEIGYRMLARIRLWEDVAPIVHSHHEWYDGTGYPEGRAGDDIPIESRIISICDAFDAMTSETSYKIAMPLEVALEEIRNGMGTQFDPQIARVFLDLVEQGAISQQ